MNRLQYPHNFPNHYIKQQYLPNEIKDNCYYKPGQNKIESLYDDYWKSIKQ